MSLEMNPFLQPPARGLDKDRSRLAACILDSSAEAILHDLVEEEVNEEGEDRVSATFDAIGGTEVEVMYARMEALAQRANVVLEDVRSIQSTDGQLETMEDAALLLARVQMNNAFLYKKIEELLEASQALEQYRREMWFAYVRHLHRAGRVAEAERVMTQQESTLPTFPLPVTVKDLIETEVCLGREEVVRPEWFRAASDQDEQLSFRFPLIKAQALRGETEAAEQAYEDGYASLTQGRLTVTRAQYLGELVYNMTEISAKMAYLRLEDYAERVRAIPSDVLDAWTRGKLSSYIAKAYLTLGREDKALEYVAGVGLTQDRWELKLELVRIYLRLNQAGNAERFLRDWEQSIDPKRVSTVDPPGELEDLLIAQGYAELGMSDEVTRLLKKWAFEEESNRSVAFRGAVLTKQIILLRLYLITEEARRVQRGL